MCRSVSVCVCGRVRVGVLSMSSWNPVCRWVVTEGKEPVLSGLRLEPVESERDGQGRSREVSDVTL